MLLTTTLSPYPAEILVLLTPAGFEQSFWSLYRSKQWESRRACFDALQDEFERLYGFRKYSEYASFCNQISRRHKGKLVYKHKPTQG